MVDGPSKLFICEVVVDEKSKGTSTSFCKSVLGNIAS